MTTQLNITPLAFHTDDVVNMFKKQVQNKFVRNVKICGNGFDCVNHYGFKPIPRLERRERSNNQTRCLPILFGPEPSTIIFFFGNNTIAF